MTFPGSAVNSFYGLRKILLPSMIIFLSLKARFGLDRKQTQLPVGTKNISQMYDILKVEVSIQPLFICILKRRKWKKNVLSRFLELCSPSRYSFQFLYFDSLTEALCPASTLILSSILWNWRTCQAGTSFPRPSCIWVAMRLAITKVMSEEMVCIPSRS